MTHDETATTRTPYILLWSFLTLIWSVFTPPHKTFAARVLLFQPLWGVRMYLGDATWAQDLALFLSLHALYSFWTGGWRFLNLSDFWWVDPNDHVFMLYVKTFSLLGACGMLAGGIVHRGERLKSSERSEYLHEQRIEEQLLPPLLITSRTSHSRLFPQQHGFSYSYLFVGIPVGFHGRAGKALSVDAKQPSWFHVSSADYLARGSQISLEEKLKRYLHTQGITDRDYAFAYLVTAPQFLGYSFNPVSFWYLYDADTVLKYMILEVNNTFDERRMYLLRAGQSESDIAKNMNGHPVDGPGDSPKKMVFTDKFDKDFHVSPFNSRKGSYSLKATDPLAAHQESGAVRIDNTIVLRSSKDSSKLVARVWSQGVPLEASKVGRLELAKLVMAWWWVGFLTFPRILWEAQKLFFQRKLHVWYRPEVVETSIGRNYTSDEKHLESFFRSFLEYSVGHSKEPLRVNYEAAHCEGSEIVMYSPGFTYEEDHKRTLTLKVLSPAFYGRFVHYAHVKEAFDRECLATDERNRTLSIASAHLMPVLIDAMAKVNNRKPQKTGLLERARWSWLQRLRCPPPEPGYSDEPVNANYSVVDIRSFRESELDIFVKGHVEDKDLYRRIATKLFLAQRFALGIPALILCLDWLVRSICLLASMYYADHSKTFDILRPREYRLGDIRTAITLMVLANTVHIWSFIRG